MYCTFFGLRRPPFESGPDTDLFFPTPAGEEALAAMEYGARHRTGPTLVTGATGTGKTIHLRKALERLNGTDRIAVLTWPSDDQRDLMRDVSAAFGISIPQQDANGRVWQRLRRNLSRAHHRGDTSILIIDQAEHLTTNNLLQLQTVVTGDGLAEWIHVILVAHPRLYAALQNPDLEKLAQRVFDGARLPSLTETETAGYIRHRIECAGGRAEAIFPPETIPLVHDAAGGIPRLINQLCEQALVAAYGAGEKTIRQTLLREIINQRPRSNSPAAYENSGQALPAENESTPAARERSPAPPADLDDVATARAEALLARAEKQRGTIESSIAQQEATERRWTSLAENAERLIERLEATIQRADASARQLENGLSRTVREAQQRLGAIDAGAARAADASSEADEQTRRIEQACADAEQVETRLHQFAETLADRAGDVEARLASLLSAIDTAEALHQKITESLERGGAMHATTDQCIQHLYKAISEARDETRKAHTTLAEAAIRNFRRQIDARVQTAVATGQEVVTHLTEATQQARTAADNADDRGRRLKARTRRSCGALRKLEEIIERAGHIHASLDETIAASDDKARRLDSHHAAVTQTLRTLAASTTDAQHLLEQLDRSKAAVETVRDQTAEQTCQWHTDLSHSAAHAQAVTEELARRTQTAREQLGEYRKLFPAAARMKDELAATLDASGQATESLRQQNETAAALAQRIEAAPALFDEARQIESTLNHAVTVARETTRELADGTTHAGREYASLTETIHAAQTVTESLGSTRHHAEDILHRLQREAGTALRRIQEESSTLLQKVHDHLATAGARITAHDSALTELTSRIQTAQQDLQSLQTRAAQVEESVTEAMEAPSHTLDAARAQATQLEHVCAAVRKVFVGLSQTSLDARNHTDACKATIETARNELAELSSQSHQAVAVLQQWVEEAVHVHARLERTLRGVPAINETHPMQPLRPPHEQTPSPPAPEAPAKNTETAEALARAEAPAQTLKNHPQPEQVARLIKEARKAIAEKQAAASSP